MIAALALAAAAQAARMAAIDRRLAQDRAEIIRAEAPLVDLLGAIERLSYRPRTAARALALRQAAAVAQAWSPAIAARTQPLRAEAASLMTERARLVLAKLLARAGLRGALQTTPVLTCADAAWRLPADALAVAPATARALGRQGGRTLVLPPGAAFPAPADGMVAYAGSFRRYGGIAILHHGHGWTSLLTGLAPAPARAGVAIGAGEPLGTAPADAPLVTVELTHHGRAIDPLAMAARCSR